MPRSSIENAVQKFHLCFLLQLVVSSRLLGVCYDCRVYLSEVVVCNYRCWLSLSVVVVSSWLLGVFSRNGLFVGYLCPLLLTFPLPVCA
jgi:hypothetical protein